MCANVLPAGCSISKDSVNEHLLERGGERITDSNHSLLKPRKKRKHYIRRSITRERQVAFNTFIGIIRYKAKLADASEQVCSNNWTTDKTNPRISKMSHLNIYLSLLSVPISTPQANFRTYFQALTIPSSREHME